MFKVSLNHVARGDHISQYVNGVIVGPSTEDSKVSFCKKENKMHLKRTQLDPPVYTKRKPKCR